MGNKPEANNAGRSPCDCGNCTDNPLVCSILESISDGVFTTDPEWRITSFNRAAEKITGVERKNALGRPCWEVFRADACETSCPLRRTLETGVPAVNRTAYIVNAEGRRIPLSISTAILKDAGGRVIGGAETFRDLSIEEELKKQLQHEAREIVSHSPAMRQILGMLPDVAASEATVVIRGETGTGKELLARALHELSPRRAGPFLAVNCGALPDNLLESELFGYKKGAFTDAKNDKPGRFALAAGGTLFLDEIGDLSPVMQVKLLRVLQERVYEPLGATRAVRADVRVITATHRDLEDLVGQDRFRRDLYYRINVVRLDLPPLRERLDDLPLLVDHFIRQFNSLRGVGITGISSQALAILQRHTFPGNIRELENIIERAFVLCHGGDILPAHLPPALLKTGMQSSPEPAIDRLDMATRQTEAEIIRAALVRHNYNRTAAARDLGIHKTTLHRKLRILKLDLPACDGRNTQ